MEYIEKERYLTVDKMQKIYDAFCEMKYMLSDIGWFCEELIDNTVSYDISPENIKSKFQAVEENIQKLHKAVVGRIIGWNDDFYKVYEWQYDALNKKQEVYRWIDWINSFYDMLSNIELIDMPIYYNKNGVDYIICDSGGKQLYYLKGIYEVN